MAVKARETLPLILVASLGLLMALLLIWLLLGQPPAWALWYSADQYGQGRYQQGRYQQAARLFQQPEWRAAALYAAGDYAAAATLYGQLRSPAGYYNQGNALAQLSHYPLAAISYRKALALQPDWPAAWQNLQLVQQLADKPAAQVEREGKARLEADGLVMDLTPAADEAEPQPLTADAGLTQAQLQQLWLRRLNPDPGAFLRLRFAYQLEQQREQQLQRRRGAGYD